MQTTVVHWGYMGIMAKKMEASTVYWGYIGIMEKKKENIVMVQEASHLQMILVNWRPLY